MQVRDETKPTMQEESKETQEETKQTREEPKPTQEETKRLDVTGRELRWWQDSDSEYHSTDSSNYWGSPIYPESYYNRIP